MAAQQGFKDLQGSDDSSAECFSLLLKGEGAAELDKTKVVTHVLQEETPRESCQHARDM